MELAILAAALTAVILLMGNLHYKFKINHKLKHNIMTNAELVAAMQVVKTEIKSYKETKDVVDPTVEAAFNDLKAEADGLTTLPTPAV